MLSLTSPLFETTCHQLNCLSPPHALLGLKIIRLPSSSDFRFWAQFIRKPVKHRGTQTNFNPQRTVQTYRTKAALKTAKSHFRAHLRQQATDSKVSIIGATQSNDYSRHQCKGDVFIIDRLCRFLGPLHRQWQVLCPNLSFLGHSCCAILDFLGTLTRLLLTRSFLP